MAEQTQLDARACLRIILGFKETLEGSVPLAEKVMVAAETARIESALIRISRKTEFGPDAREAIGELAEFIRLLPDFSDTNFKARRHAREYLHEAIRHVARIVAISNKLERKRQE
jgi:hypothetical protein